MDQLISIQKVEMMSAMFTVEAPPINLENELNKAKDKIYRELDQLPPDKPAIVVIPTESFLFFAFDFQDIITGIAEEANYHPNLLCVALLHAVMEGLQESTTVTFGDHGTRDQHGRPLHRTNDLCDEWELQSSYFR